MSESAPNPEIDVCRLRDCAPPPQTVTRLAVAAGLSNPHGLRASAEQKVERAGRKDWSGIPPPQVLMARSPARLSPQTTATRPATSRGSAFRSTQALSTRHLDQPLDQLVRHTLAAVQRGLGRPEHRAM